MRRGDVLYDTETTGLMARCGLRGIGIALKYSIARRQRILTIGTLGGDFAATCGPSTHEPYGKLLRPGPIFTLANDGTITANRKSRFATTSTNGSQYEHP